MCCVSTTCAARPSNHFCNTFFLQKLYKDTAAYNYQAVQRRATFTDRMPHCISGFLSTITFLRIPNMHVVNGILLFRWFTVRTLRYELFECERIFVPIHDAQVRLDWHNINSRSSILQSFSNCVHSSHNTYYWLGRIFIGRYQSWIWKTRASNMYVRCIGMMSTSW